MSEDSNKPKSKLELIVSLIRPLMPFIGWAFVFLSLTYFFNDGSITVISLAGKRTDVNVAISLTVALSLSLAGVTGMLLHRNRHLQRELDKCREAERRRQDLIASLDANRSVIRKARGKRLTPKLLGDVDRALENVLRDTRAVMVKNK